MNIQQIKEKYTCLDWLGEPVKKVANGYLYHVPWREDRKPSLSVTLNGKGWHDLATGEHGNLIAMVKKCLNTDSLSRVCAEFSNVLPNHFSLPQPKNYEGKEKEVVYSRFELLPLRSRGLFAYLYHRKVNLDIAKQFLQEARYSTKQPDDGSYLYSLAYANDKGGYELRNGLKDGKLCKEPKSITTHWLIDDAPVVVFEGFFDMLSFSTLCGGIKHNYLVLNSTTMTAAAIEKLKEFKGKIYLALDNDKAGTAATEKMLEQLPNAVDIRAKFAPYKDVNEYLVQRAKNNTPNHTKYDPMKNTQGQPNGRGQTAPVSDGSSVSCEVGACTGRSSEGLFAVPSPVGHSDACIGGP